jgi:hypothetical protein
MSQALWCDQKQHAFSSRDPEKQNYTRRVTKHPKDYDPRYANGVIVEEQFDICGPCATGANLFTEEEKAQKQITNGDKIPAGKKLVDADEYARYLAHLEQEALGVDEGEIVP